MGRYITKGPIAILQFFPLLFGIVGTFFGRKMHQLSQDEQELLLLLSRLRSNQRQRAIEKARLSLMINSALWPAYQSLEFAYFVRRVFIISFRLLHSQ